MQNAAIVTTTLTTGLNDGRSLLYCIGTRDNQHEWIDIMATRVIHTGNNRLFYYIGLKFVQALSISRVKIASQRFFLAG